MGYYIRVLSTSSECIPLSRLYATIKTDKLKATLSVDEGEPDKWTHLILSHADGKEIALVERNSIEAGTLGADELDEFAEEVTGCKPTLAADWIVNYLKSVKSIYAFQLLSGTDHKNGWDIFGAIKNCVWSFAPSIIQADLEGFTNEDGYHILWQFSDSAKRNWWMGVLVEGQWKHFQMNLGDRKQRDAFLEGRIPEGVKLA